MSVCELCVHLQPPVISFCKIVIIMIKILALSFYKLSSKLDINKFVICQLLTQRTKTHASVKVCNSFLLHILHNLCYLVKSQLVWQGKNIIYWTQTASFTPQLCSYINDTNTNQTVSWSGLRFVPYMVVQGIFQFLLGDLTLSLSVYSQTFH